MQSFIKKALIVVLAMSLLAVAGWFGRKAYKKITERRLVAQAAQHLERDDRQSAALCLKRALQISPLSIEACRLTADMLDAGRSPMALSWRIRAAQLQPDKSQFRLDWAQTALKFQDYNSASNALAGLDQKARETAAYQKLAGALAWTLHDGAAAEKHYLEAGRLEPTNQTVALNLATIRLISTNPGVADAARLSLQSIATNNAVRSAALHHLAADAATRRVWPEAIRYYKLLLDSPAANTSEKVDYLQILHQAQSSEYAGYLESLKAEAARSAACAFQLGRWMASVDGATNTLRWLQTLPLHIQTNQPVPLVITDCQIALRDWKGLQRQVAKQDWGEADYYRLALESLAQRSLGESLVSESAWRKSLRESSRRLDRLATLSSLAGTWGWTNERKEVLEQITGNFPKEKWASELLVGYLYAEGKTRELGDLLLKISAADPSDSKLKNNLANIYLLRKTDLTKAHRLAKEAYETAPENPFFISTYAYSLLLQGKADEAVTVVQKLNPQMLQIPALAAYYGVVQAQAGHKEVAKESLNRAEAAPRLLPEEKLVRLAKAHP